MSHGRSITSALNGAHSCKILRVPNLFRRFGLVTPLSHYRLAHTNELGPVVLEDDTSDQKIINPGLNQETKSFRHTEKSSKIQTNENQSEIQRPDEDGQTLQILKPTRLRYVTRRKANLTWDSFSYNLPRNRPMSRGTISGNIPLSELGTLNHLLKIRDRGEGSVDKTVLSNLHRHRLPPVFPLIWSEDILTKYSEKSRPLSPQASVQQVAGLKLTARSLYAQKSRLPKNVVMKILRRIRETSIIYGHASSVGAENLHQKLVSAIMNPIAELFSGYMRKIPRQIPELTSSMKPNPAEDFKAFGLRRRTEDVYITHKSATMVCISTATIDESGVEAPTSLNDSIGQIVAEMIALDFYNEHVPETHLPIIGCLFHKRALNIVFLDTIADTVYVSIPYPFNWYPSADAVKDIRAIQMIANMIYDAMLSALINGLEASARKPTKQAHMRSDVDFMSDLRVAAHGAQQALDRAREAAKLINDETKKLQADALSNRSVEDLKASVNRIPESRYNRMEPFSNSQLPWTKSLL